MAIFFKPADAWAGDFIPFYCQGEYHLFYLKDCRDKTGHGEGIRGGTLVRAILSTSPTTAKRSHAVRKPSKTCTCSRAA